MTAGKLYCCVRRSPLLSLSLIDLRSTEEHVCMFLCMSRQVSRRASGPGATIAGSCFHQSALPRQNHGLGDVPAPSTAVLDNPQHRHLVFPLHHGGNQSQSHGSQAVLYPYRSDQHTSLLVFGPPVLLERARGHRIAAAVGLKGCFNILHKATTGPFRGPKHSSTRA